MTRKFYTHSLRISYTYTVYFDPIHAPFSTSNSPWTHTCSASGSFRVPTPNIFLLPTPGFLKIPQSTISAAHNAHVSGATSMEHGDTPVTPLPRKRTLTPQQLSTTHSSSGRSRPSWDPALFLLQFGGFVLTASHVGLAHVTTTAANP